MVKSYLESIHIHLVCPECKTTYYVEATDAFKEADINLNISFNCPNCNNKLPYSLLGFPHYQHITYHDIKEEK